MVNDRNSKASVFLASLRQRHVYRVAVAYAAAAWLLLQVADVTVDSFAGPSWLMQVLIACLAVGFPLAVMFAWLRGARGSGENPDRAQPTGKSSPAAPLPADKPSLIVLPFDCLSDLPSDRWHCDALTGDLTTLIARTPGLSVLARNTAFAYQGRRVDVRTLGRELGVRYVLEGSVRRSDAGLRVTAQLVETESGAQLWGEQYDAPTEDFDRLEDELCQKIVRRLGMEVTRAEIALYRRKPPSEWGAWELYQQARGRLQFSGWSVETFEDIVGLLRDALERDPGLAPAHGYLALILALGHWTRMYPDREAAYTSAMEEIDRALALAPDSSEVLGYTGCALSDLGHPDRGLPLIERAVELDPSNSQAHAALGAAKVISGRLEEGKEDLRHAITISPVDPGLAPWCMLLSLAESLSGDPGAGLIWADKARKADPRYFGGHIARAAACLALGRADEARAAFQEATHVNRDLTEDTIVEMLGAENWASLQALGVSLPILGASQV